MKVKAKIRGLAILVSIVSCTDTSINNKIATIKNNTPSIITCALLKNGVMTDSLLYNDTSLNNYQIQPYHYDTYMEPDSDLTKAPDSATTYIYILKSDSINKFRKLKLTNGILKHSLLKKIIVQLNKVKEPLDTIYVR